MSIVPGVGPQPAKWALIMDAPNKEDAAKRKPLSGRAGKELDRFFDDYSIPARNKWWVTYSYKALWDDKAPPTAEDVALHHSWLAEEIAETRPRFVVLMGKRTLAHFLGTDHDASDWYGLATTSPLVPGVPVMPCISPGAAFVSPEFYRKFAVSMGRLEMLLKGTLPPQPVDDGNGHYEWLFGKAVDTLIQSL